MVIDMVVITGAIRRAMLQSNCHHQQTNTSVEHRVRQTSSARQWFVQTSSLTRRNRSSSDWIKNSTASTYVSTDSRICCSLASPVTCVQTVHHLTTNSPTVSQLSLQSQQQQLVCRNTADQPQITSWTPQMNGSGSGSGCG